MTKAQEMLYAVGVENLFITFMEGGKDTQNGLPVYEDKIYSLPTIETIGITGNQSTTTKWASNKQLVNATKTSTFTLTLDYPSLPIEISDKMLGLNAKRGIAFEDGKTKELPYFAVGFIAPLSDGSKIARWYPRSQVTPPSESYSTITQEEAPVPTQQLVMTASPLLFNDVTKVDYNSARDGVEGVTAEDFMSQVVSDESQLSTLFPSA